MKEYQGNWQAILVASPCMYIYIYMRQLYEHAMNNEWIVIMEEIPNRLFSCHLNVMKNVKQTFPGSFVGLATPTPCSTSKWCKRHSAARGGPPKVQHGPQHLATSWQSSIAMEHPQCLQGSGWKDGGFHGKFCNTTVMALGKTTVFWRMVSNSQAFLEEHPSNFRVKNKHAFEVAVSQAPLGVWSSPSHATQKTG